MTRSIVSGLLGLFGVAFFATFPLGCPSGGVGDPCTPEDEYSAQFAGFKVTEHNIESRSFQCQTRICLVNHFQGRVSCPLGQQNVGEGGRKACRPGDNSACGSGERCVEASSLDRKCESDADCVSAGAGFACINDRCRAYLCHKEGNCQNPEADDAANEGKDCCLPGTDTPVVSPVCGQCDEASKRNADDAVYCSCRCGVAEGEQDDGSFNFCDCPDGYACEEVRPDVGLGDKQLTGKYCIKEGTKFDQASKAKCGKVEGAKLSFCEGTAASVQ